MTGKRQRARAPGLRQLTQEAQHRRSVQVLVEHPKGRARHGSLPGFRAAPLSGPPESARQPVRGRHPSAVVVERPAVVLGQQVQAKPVRVRPAERVAHEDHVAGGLGHLLPGEPHGSDVDPEPDERPIPRRLALGQLRLMMREDEVSSAAVNVERQSQMALRHRRALEMPSRSTPAEWARKGRPVGHAAPQREIEGMALARIVEPRVVLGGEDLPHPGRRETRERSVPGEASHVVVEAAAGEPVGVPRPQEPTGERAHCRDLSRGVRHDVGRPPSEGPHVGEKAALLAPGQRPPRLPIAGRALQDRFVDVGDVLDVADPTARGLQVTDEHVEHQERAGVTEVCRVIGRDAAHVEPHRPSARSEDPTASSAGVVEAQHRRWASRVIASRTFDCGLRPRDEEVCEDSNLPALRCL